MPAHPPPRPGEPEFFAALQPASCPVRMCGRGTSPVARSLAPWASADIVRALRTLPAQDGDGLSELPVYKRRKVGRPRERGKQREVPEDLQLTSDSASTLTRAHAAALKECVQSVLRDSQPLTTSRRQLQRALAGEAAVQQRRPGLHAPPPPSTSRSLSSIFPTLNAAAPPPTPPLARRLDSEFDASKTP